MDTIRSRAQVLVTRGNKFVLIFRHKNGENYYSMPGGGIKVGETPLEAARREIQEELGLKLKNLALFSEIKTESRHDFNFTAETDSETFVVVGPEKKQLDDPHNLFKPEWHDRDSMRTDIHLYPESARQMLQYFLNSQS